MSKGKKIIFNIIVFVAIVLFTIVTVPKTLQEDTYYMIKVGEYICQNGMGVIADRIEPFAWVPDLIYTYPHWLLDIVFYQIHNMFDFMGIYVFTVISGIIIYSLIYFTNVKVCKNHVLSAIFTFIAIYFLRGFIAARSQIVTFFCLILEVLFIESYLETGHKRWLIGLILDPILLANTHAALFPIYFVVFLPYIAEYLIAIMRRKDRYERKIKHLENKVIPKWQKEVEEEPDPSYLAKYKEKLSDAEEKLKNVKEKLAKLEEKQAKKKEISKEGSKIYIDKNNRVKWLIVIFIICIFTGLLTPIKDIPYTYMYKSIKGNTMNFIAEHQAVTLIYDFSLVIMFAIAIFACFSNKVKLKLRDFFMLGGMTILSLISYKQFPIFFICTVSILNKLVSMIIARFKENRRQLKEAMHENSEISEENKALDVEDIESNEEEEKPQRKKLSLAFIKEKIKNIPNSILTIKGMIFCILIIAIIAIPQYGSIITQDLVDRRSYPVEASQWINDNIDKENMKLFNDFNYGSYLIYRDIPVFIDGRADVYDPVFNGRTDDSFLAYMLASSLQVWYENVIYDYEITHVITTAGSTLNMLMEKNEYYEELYNDGLFVIYKVNYDDEHNPTIDEDDKETLKSGVNENKNTAAHVMAH